MPRFPRSYIQTNYFHLITQGINKEYIFNADEDIRYYINAMNEAAINNTVEIVAYCIMNNHAHMLVNTLEIINLSNYMHTVNTKYGKYYNKKYNRVGYVFRDRYKSEGIYSEKQLLTCINYIFNNPIKAGICKRPEDYPYSNYKKTYDIEDENYVFIDVDEEKDEERIVNEYLIENGLKIDELVNNEYELKQVIRFLKRDKVVSLRRIAKLLNISREKVRKKYIE